MRGWWRLFVWEMHKVTRRRSSYLGFALCVVFCALVLLVFGYSQFRALEQHSRHVTDNARAYVNGYFFSTFVLYFGFKALLPLLAGVIPGAQIAGEAKDGTLRMLLTRPPSRFAVFFTKLLVSYLWLLITVYFLIFFSLLLGWAALGGGDFLVFVWEFRHYGAWFADEGDWITMFLLTGFGASMGLFVVVAFSLSLSALTDSPVVAYVGALGGFFISSIIQRLPEQLLHPAIRRIMPTTHMDSWHEFYWLFYDDPSRFNEFRFWSDIKWCTMYTIVFLAIGLIAFTRKDISS